ncbi:MAG: hypothetical protein ACRC06_04630 [Waterburya sp.]
MNTYKRSVGLFYSQDEAEAALRALKKGHFDMNRVNVIAKNANQVTDSENVDVGYNEGNNAAEGAGAGATSGAVLGGITGLLIGLGTLAIPGVGPIIVAGEAATAIATTLAGAGIGAAAGGIVGGLVGLGIPEDKAKIYSDRVSSGSYLVMVNGSDDDINRAEEILHQNGIEEYGVYDAPDIDDDSYNRTSSVNRVDTGERVNTMGNTSMSDEVYPAESRTSMRDEVYPAESTTSMSDQDLTSRRMSNRDEVYPAESTTSMGTSMNDNPSGMLRDRDLAMNDRDLVDPLEPGTMNDNPSDTLRDRDLETRQRNDRSTTSNDADVIIVDNRDETR